jgi:poly(hydroxyalkanoate) granule-associated protein
MAKAAIKETVEAGSSLLGEVRNYSRQIWLAGLGAYAKAGQEGLGYLKELVETGADVEQKGKELVGDQVESVSSRFVPVRNRLEVVREKAEGQFEKIEAAFDDRVARALNRLGIPSRQDVDALSAKLDVLNAMLASANKTK